MKSFEHAKNAAINRANPVQRVSQPTKTIIDNRPMAVMQRKLQGVINSRSQQVAQLITPFQGFQKLINGIAEEVGEGSAKYKELKALAIKNNVSKYTQDQQTAYATARQNLPDKYEEYQYRAMLENLIQSDWNGIGSELKNTRMMQDNNIHLTVEPEKSYESIYRAFQQALFFRGERIISEAPDKGYLNYNGEIHGKKGSASVSPSKDVDNIKNRADGNLFVSKSRKEIKDYIEKAQGGDREVLTIIASEAEVQAMQYDVDSGGYKTRNALTGIVKDRMTPKALQNLCTWIPDADPTNLTPEFAEKVNDILKQFLK